MPTEDQIPLPCTSCGAPMREVAAPGVGISITCDHCGCTEALPDDLTERVIHLRMRLQHLASAQGRLHGFIQSVFIGWKKVLPWWLLMLALMAHHLFTRTLPRCDAFFRDLPDMPVAAQQAQLADMLLPDVRLFVAMGGLAAVFVGGYIYTRLRILPLLHARPPREEGDRPRVSVRVTASNSRSRRVGGRGQSRAHGTQDVDRGTARGAERA